MTTSTKEKTTRLPDRQAEMMLMLQAQRRVSNRNRLLYNRNHAVSMKTARQLVDRGLAVWVPQDDLVRGERWAITRPLRRKGSPETFDYYVEVWV